MAEINEAELLQREIENHNHFDKCLEISSKNEFYSKRDELRNALNCFNELKSTEIEIINATHNKKNVEQELSNLKSISERDLENLKQKLSLMEKLYLKNNENELNNLKDKFCNFQLKNKYDTEQLDTEISNLNKQINAKKESLNTELNLKKKKNFLNWKMNTKLSYFNIQIKKKLEKQEKEKENEIKLKKFEADKTIEFIELKRKADLVQRIIKILKNKNLN